MKIGDKFVKDGEVVEVTDIGFAIFENENGRKVTVSGLVMFKGKNGNGISFKSDFLEQYKPYNPIYEFQYFYEHKISKSANAKTLEYYKDDTEFCNKNNTEEINFQRLDFTRRKRVQ